MNTALGTMVRVLGAALVLVVLSTVVRAETYYLDTSATGSTYDGSQANPWQTVVQMQTFLNGLSDHGSGDTVLIAPGSYDRWVDGAVVNTGFTSLEEQQHPRTDWLTLRAADPDNAPTFDYIQIYGNRDAYVRLDALHIQSAPPHRPYCVYIRNGTRKIELLNLEVDALDDESQLPEGIATTYNNPTDILIEGCDVHHVDSGILPSGANITVRNNELHHIAGSAVKSGGGTNMIVEGNTIHHQEPRIVRLNIYGAVSGTFTKYESITQDVTGAKATVYVIRADSLEVTPPNKVTIQFQPGHAVRADDGSGTVAALTNVTVADRTHGSGLSVRTNGYTARGNHIYNYGGTAGIFCYPIGEAYSNMLFENNLVHDAITRTAVFNDVGDNVVIRNNTFIGGVQAYFFEGFEDGSGFHLYNNLFTDFTVYYPAALPGIHEDRNIFQNVGTRSPWTQDASFPAGSTSVMLGYDAAGQAAFNALFADAAADDFRLAGGSQAIDFANPANAPAADLNGFARGAAPDAGCFEFGTGTAGITWAVATDHGPAGTIETPLADGTVEPRVGGFGVVKITSNLAIDPVTVDGSSVTLTGAVGGNLSSLIGSVSLDEDQRTVTVTLNGPLPDGDSVTMALADTVRTVTGTAPAENLDVTVVMRVGDVNASGQTGAGDILAIREAAGQAVTPANARYDLDRSGTITTADMAAVRNAAAGDE